jgi:hypothetical protein
MGITTKYATSNTKFVTIVTRKIMNGKLSIGGTGIATVDMFGIR